MLVIGIAGGSGSGKTTVVKAIKDRLKEDVVVIPQDAYYKDSSNLTDEQKRNQNFDHPDAIDWDLLCKQLSELKEGKTKPPKRYTSGNLILAMENAGQLIEDPSLREQIRSSGIGTSATRAEILKKLVSNDYLSLNKKTQIITPTLVPSLLGRLFTSLLTP